MKIWKMFVIAGGVIGLSLIPILDIAVYFSVQWYPHSPELLLQRLEQLALIGLILKYLLVAVGIVGLVGWYLEMPEAKSREHTA